MSKLAIDIVKRGGARPSEKFSRDKIRLSIVAACLSVRSPKGQAELIADEVCDAVIVWCRERPVVTSADLRRVAAIHLQRHHPDAAYIYEYHRNTI